MLLQQLPVAAAIEQVEQQPVLVRTYYEPNSVTVLVVNTCPWSTDARIKIQAPRAVALEPLAGTDLTGTAVPMPRTTIAPGGPPWSLKLEPYAVEAVRIASRDVKVSAVDVRVTSAARTELAARLAELNERDTAPRLSKSLVNPSFEPMGGEVTQAGWRLLANPSVATAELNATDPHDGKTCLYLRSIGPLAVVESNVFPTPPTGQFALTVFVRGRNLAPDAELRIALEAERERPIYRRFNALHGRRGGPDRLDNGFDDQWRPFAILVNSLPLDSRATMRVRFELLGAGEVWLDEIKTYQLLFPLPFYENKDPEWIVFAKLIGAAGYAYEHGQFSDSVKYLEGYWPRFLAAYTPLNQPRIARDLPPEQPRASPPAPNPPPQESPSLGERIRRLLLLR
jgi:hypothetical protein